MSNNFLKRFRNRQALTDDGTFGTTLLCLVIDTYGYECLEWLPETLLAELQDDFNVELKPSIFDRLVAAITLVQENSFYQAVPDFIQICNVLSGSSYRPEFWDPADAEELAWGVVEAQIISPVDEDDQFSREVTAYIGQTLDREGLRVAPISLSIATDRKELTAQEDFSDDPEMFNNVFDLQQGRTDAINQLVISNLQQLQQQLDSLQLEDGKTSDAVTTLLRTLAKETNEQNIQ